MEQPKVPDKGIGRAYRTLQTLELGMKLTGGRAETLSILKDQMPNFLRAALATGFKVEQIANEGEEFPVKSWDEDRRMPTENVISYVAGSGQKVCTIEVKKGHIAVSIEKPEESKAGTDFTPFWDKLESIQQKKV